MVGKTWGTEGERRGARSPLQLLITWGASNAKAMTCHQPPGEQDNGDQSSSGTMPLPLWVFQERAWGLGGVVSGGPCHWPGG